MPWSRIQQPWPNPGRPQHSSSSLVPALGSPAPPKPHFAMGYWSFLEASHGLCELLPALWSTAVQPSAAPRLCCMTLGVLLKVTVPKNRADLCVWFREDRRAVAQQALAALAPLLVPEQPLIAVTSPAPRDVGAAVGCLCHPQQWVHCRTRPRMHQVSIKARILNSV